MENNLNQIEEQIRALEDQRRQILEDQRKKELEAQRKITINISKLDTIRGKFTINISRPVWSIVDWLRYHTDRYTLGTNNDHHVVSIKFYEPFLNHLNTDEIKNNFDIDLIYEKGFSDKLEEYKNQPDIYVDVDRSAVNLKLGPNIDRGTFYLGNDISTLTQGIKGLTFSVTELPFFPEAITKYPNLKVEYSPNALNLLTSSLEKRKEISELATAEDTSLPNPFVDPFDLKGHQRVAVKFTELSGGRAIIAYDMGTGKTAIACGLAERNPQYKRVVVLCPASLKTNWKRDIKKFTGKDAIVLQGIEPDALSIDLLMNPEYKYFIINYDVIGREIGGEKGKNVRDDKRGVMKWVEVFNVIGVDLWIIDEAHYIKNMDSARSRGTRALKFKDVIPMSGTPIVNRPMELFPLLSIVAPETFNSEASFRNQFIDSEGYPRNVQKLHKLLTPYMIRRTRKDVYGELHIERIPFTKELSAKARPIYNKILEGIYISLRKPDYQRNVTSILAELIRCKQVCSADNVETTAELAQDAQSETGKKVIVFSQFKESQYAIQQILGNESAVINGDVGDEARYDLVDKFQKPDSRLNYIITNILEGLTLTEAHTVIFNDLWWTPKDHQQAEGRAFGRTNDPHGGNAYYLQNENSIDEFINALLLKKMKIFEQMIDGVNSGKHEEGEILNSLLKHLKEGF